MAERIERFSTVAAAGASNLSVSHAFIEGTVTRVSLYVPDGHAGFTSWRFFYGDSQLIPFTAGVTVVGNDRAFEWDLDNAPTGSGYRSVVSNTDVYSHAFQVTVELVPLDSPDPELAQLPILVIPLA